MFVFVFEDVVLFVGVLKEIEGLVDGVFVGDLGVVLSELGVEVGEVVFIGFEFIDMCEFLSVYCFVGGEKFSFVGEFLLVGF